MVSDGGGGGVPFGCGFRAVAGLGLPGFGAACGCGAPAVPAQDGQDLAGGGWVGCLRAPVAVKDGRDRVDDAPVIVTHGSPRPKQAPEADCSFYVAVFDEPAAE